MPRRHLTSAQLLDAIEKSAGASGDVARRTALRLIDLAESDAVGAVMVGRHSSMSARLRRLDRVVPPLQEQVAITEYAERETKTVNTAIARLEREIDLLREYRTRLVADVVTGTLDVREAARQLPEEAAGPERVADTERDPEEAEV
jgi:hypothetical protein